jgi:hypothetical protein
MTLIHESGFIENVDDWISGKYKFHHLPYPVRCLLCGVNWLSIFYVIITGQLSLLTLMLCLLNAHLTQITQPLFRFIMNALLKVVELLNRLVD